MARWVLVLAILCAGSARAEPSERLDPDALGAPEARTARLVSRALFAAQRQERDAVEAMELGRLRDRLAELGDALREAQAATSARASDGVAPEDLEAHRAARREEVLEDLQELALERARFDSRIGATAGSARARAVAVRASARLAVLEAAVLDLLTRSVPPDSPSEYQQLIQSLEVQEYGFGSGRGGLPDPTRQLAPHPGSLPSSRVGSSGRP